MSLVGALPVPLEERTKVVEIVVAQGRDGQPHVRLWDRAIGNAQGRNRASGLAHSMNGVKVL